MRNKTTFLYKKHSSLRDYFCFYCGQYGESKDYVPARSYVEIFCKHERLLVRSCIECNTYLSNKPFHTLLSRCEFLLSRYIKKYKKLLFMPKWSEEEIDELNGRLKSKIIVCMKKKSFIEKRIKHLNFNIENINSGV